MDCHTDSDHISYEHKIPVGMRGIGMILPLEDQPEHKSRTERRERVDLALYRREPECIAPAVSKCAYNTTAHYHQILRKRQLLTLGIADHKTPNKMRDGPEQQKYGKSRKQSAHGIHHKRDRLDIRSEIRKETGREHKDRVARRVPDFQLVGLDYKLAAVPIGGGRLESEPISDESDEKDRPSDHIID